MLAGKIGNSEKIRKTWEQMLIRVWNYLHHGNEEKPRINNININDFIIQDAFIGGNYE